MSPTAYSWTLRQSSTASSLTQEQLTGGEDVPRDFALDDDGDLALRDGDLFFLTGAEAVRSDLKARLSFFKGEWFLNTDEGIPYFDEILVKQPNLQGIRSIFRDAILNTLGVSELNSLLLGYTAASRSLVVSFRVTTDFGELIDDTVNLTIA